MYQSNSMQMYEKRKENEEQNNILQWKHTRKMYQKTKEQDYNLLFSKELVWWIVPLMVPDESGHLVSMPSAVPSHMVPSLGHMTCSGQLDIRNVKQAEALLSMWELCSPSFHNYNHVSKLTRVPLMMKDHTEREAHSSQLSSLSPALADPLAERVSPATQNHQIKWQNCEK